MTRRRQPILRCVTASLRPALIRRRSAASTRVVASVVLAMAAALPQLALAQPKGGWLGKRVVQKFSGMTLKVDNQVIVVRTVETYHVEEVDGAWLRLRIEGRGQSGWAHEEEVVPIDQAIEYFGAAIRANPDDAYSLTMRAIILEKEKKDYDKALSDYNEVVRLAPKGAYAYVNRGWCLYLKKDYDKAIADYDEAIRLEPKNAPIYNNRGIAWHGKDDDDRAIADYDEAIRLEPDYILPYHNRGIAWHGKNEIDQAIAAFDEAIWHDPEYAAAYIGRGNARRARRQYPEAIADYNEAIRLDPRNTWATLNRSVAQMLANQDEAIRGFWATINRRGWTGGDAIYAVLMGHLAARRFGDDAAARSFLEASTGKLKTDWPYPVVQFLRGEISERALLALAVDDEKRTEARSYLGLDHALRGHKAEAIAHLRWVVNRGKRTFVEYPVAAAELERLANPAPSPAKPATPNNP